VDRLPDSAGARVRWLITLEIGGQTLRYSDGAVDVVWTDGGVVLPFRDGLLEDVSIVLAATPYSAEAVTAEASVSLLPDVDLAALAAQGHRIHGARAEIARWVEGTAYEDRRVMLVGRLSEPEYGGAGEELSTSIGDAVWEDRSYTSAVALRVDGYTWANADTLAAANLGLQYPIVIGRPGRVGGSALPAVGWVPATKMVWVDHSADAYPGAGNLSGLIGVIAGHHSRSTRVWGVTTEEPEGQRLRCYQGVDLRGQAVTFIAWYYEITAGTTEPYEWDAGGTYSFGATEGAFVTRGLGTSGTPPSFQDDAQSPIGIGWYDDVDGDAAAGGLEVNGQLVRSAPDVLAYLLGLTSIEVDRGRIQAAAAALGAYQIDAVIEARAGVWDWLSTYLLPILPIAVMVGPQGLYVRVWSADAPVVATIDLDAVDVDCSGRITEGLASGDNQVVVRYARHALTGEYLGVVTVGAAMDRPPWPATLTALLAEVYQTSPGCDASRVRGDKLSTREIEAPVVYDTATAWRIAHAVAGELGRRSRVVRAGVPEYRYRMIDLWSVVRVTSARLSIDGRARVDEIGADGSGNLGLLLSLL